MTKLRAKVNMYSEGKQYKAGELYDAKEVKHLDKNDFEEVKEKKSGKKDK